MSGQATVTIDGNSWLTYMATLSWELSQGLSGVASMDAGTGMLFDTGYQHQIGVTTEQMLFNLDIAFISDELKVVEIHSNVAPGVVFTSAEQARYFLEVNAGELAAVSVGDDVDIVVTSVPVYAPGQAFDVDSIWNMITTMLPMVMVGGFGIGLVRSAAGDNPGYGGGPGPYGGGYTAPMSREWRTRLRSMSTAELQTAYSRVRIGEPTGIDFVDASPGAGEEAIYEILWERGKAPRPMYVG